jgi:hypothetical protein
VATVSGYQYHPAGTDVFSPNAIASALHTALLLAGWTCEYLDADAIGTGTLEAPAWDKTPTTNQTVGVAVYRMPANGSLTRWYVRPEVGWFAASTRTAFRTLTVGTAHSGSGVLTGGNASSPLAATSTTITTSGYGWALNASENGFYIGSTSSPWMYCERVRSPGEVVEDEVKLSICHTTAASMVAQLVSATLGVVNNSNQAVYLINAAGWAGVSPANSVAGDIHAGPLVTGPYFMDGDPYLGPPRLFIAIPSADVTVGTLVDLNVDGSWRAYMPLGTAPSFQVTLVATE